MLLFRVQAKQWQQNYYHHPDGTSSLNRCVLNLISFRHRDFIASTSTDRRNFYTCFNTRRRVAHFFFYRFIGSRSCISLTCFYINIISVYSYNRHYPWWKRYGGLQLWNGENDYVKCIPDKNDLHFYALCIRLFYVVEYGLFRVCEWNSLYHYYVRVPSGRSRALPWPCLRGHGVVHTSTVLGVRPSLSSF